MQHLILSRIQSKVQAVQGMIKTIQQSERFTGTPLNPDLTKQGNELEHGLHKLLSTFPALKKIPEGSDDGDQGNE